MQGKTKIQQIYHLSSINRQHIKQHIHILLGRLPQNTKHSLIVSLIVIFAYAILTLIFTYPILLSDTLIPGGGDAYFYLWDLWWYKEALLSFSSPYWTPYLFHPTGLPLALSAITPFNGIVSVPLQLVFGLVRTYNILWTGSFIIAGYGTYLLVKYLTNNSKAAFVSGLIFMFSPYHFAHALGHLNLLSVEWIPFYILYLFKTLKEPELKNAIIAAIFLLFVALSEYTYLLYSLIFTAIILLFNILDDKNSLINNSVIKRLFLLSTIFTIIFLPFAYPLLRELIASQSQYIYSGGFVTYSADIVAYFIPSQLHPIFGDLVDPLYQNITGNIAEYTIFAGYTVLFLTLLAIIKTKNKEIKFWILSLGAFILLSLGPLLHFNGVVTGAIEGTKFAVPLPYSLIMQIPIISIARAPSRFDVIVMLILSVLAGYGLCYILKASEGARFYKIRVDSLLSIIFAAFILFEFLAIPFPVSNTNIPDFYQSLSKDPEEYAIYEIPNMGGYLCFQEYLYYQTAHEKKLLTGYTHIPDYVTKFSKDTPYIRNLHMEYANPDNILAYNNDIISQNISDTALFTLNQYNIRYIVLHENLLTAKQSKFAEHLLQSSLNVEPLVYKKDNLIVYKVPKTSIKSIMALDSGWHGLENWFEIPTRWIANDAIILINSNENRTTNLTFRALSFYKPQKLEIYCGDTLQTQQTIATNLTNVYAQVSLHRGENTIRLHIPEGGNRPIDIPELNNRDTRILSIALQNISIQ